MKEEQEERRAMAALAIPRRDLQLDLPVRKPAMHGSNLDLTFSVTKKDWRRTRNWRQIKTQQVWVE